MRHRNCHTCNFWVLGLCVCFLGRYNGRSTCCVAYKCCEERGLPRVDVSKKHCQMVVVSS